MVKPNMHRTRRTQGGEAESGCGQSRHRYRILLDSLPVRGKPARKSKQKFMRKGKETRHACTLRDMSNKMEKISCVDVGLGVKLPRVESRWENESDLLERHRVTATCHTFTAAVPTLVLNADSDLTLSSSRLAPSFPLACLSHRIFFAGLCRPAKLPVIGLHSGP